MINLYQYFERNLDQPTIPNAKLENSKLAGMQLLSTEVLSDLKLKKKYDKILDLFVFYQSDKLKYKYQNIDWLDFFCRLFISSWVLSILFSDIINQNEKNILKIVSGTVFILEIFQNYALWIIEIFIRKLFVNLKWFDFILSFIHHSHTKDAFEIGRLTYLKKEVRWHGTKEYKRDKYATYNKQMDYIFDRMNTYPYYNKIQKLRNALTFIMFLGFFFTLLKLAYNSETITHIFIKIIVVLIFLLISIFGVLAMSQFAYLIIQSLSLCIRAILFNLNLLLFLFSHIFREKHLSVIIAILSFGLFLLETYIEFSK